MGGAGRGGRHRPDAALLIYPDWIGQYLDALKALAPQDQWWNASVFPYGLLALPVAFMPVEVGKMRRARMVAAATLLASPYFAWYHATTALMLETRGPMVWISWLDAIPRILFGEKKLAWIIPLIMLAWDAWTIWRERRAIHTGDAKP